MTMVIRRHVHLSERTTLKMGGEAACEVTVRAEEDFHELGNFLMTETLRPFVIGKGSNLLATGDVSDVALIRVESPSIPQRVEQTERGLVFRARAGLKLPAVLGWSQKAGLTGMENLTGIPGTVGGAVAMNAGSYGTEMKDVVTRVRLWTPTEGLEWVDAEDCTWGYRHFTPGKACRCLIWEVEMALKGDSSSAVRKRMKKVIERKKATQPVTAKTAGCVFKNPEGDSAGRLLDEAGFRGRRLGGCGFSKMHANFLENLGGGTADEALELMNAAKEAVAEQFGVTLETEVIIL